MTKIQFLLQEDLAFSKDLEIKIFSQMPFEDFHSVKKVFLCFAELETL